MTNKTKPLVKLKIQLGQPTPHMKKCWGLFWSRIIGDCKREVKADER